LRDWIEFIRIKVSDIVVDYIATWKFLFIYTIVMILWIYLHKINVLTIDGSDFYVYSLFLSWAAGIQASVILMTSNRQLEKDRETLLKSVDLDSKTLKYLEEFNESDKYNHECMNKNAQLVEEKVNGMYMKLSKIEEIIDLMEREKGKLDFENGNG
jgi:uncharacterized membrane protein